MSRLNPEIFYCWRRSLADMLGAALRAFIEGKMEEADARERERRAARVMARKESREALAKQRNEQAAALLAGCAKLRWLPFRDPGSPPTRHEHHKTAWTDPAVYET